MEKCIVCGKTAEKHHIVYKNQGGIDIPLNYVYLCFEHHRGIEGPHKNRKIDLKYKLKFQNELKNILTKDFYSMSELIKLLNINPRQSNILLTQIKKYKLGYRKNDIIKRIMGGRIYE
ncbi:HNH endonuclease [Clostridium aestuarii]|uniref:HNH endonuclease n=1 Tax=Clostridium aestuarii TaxID=338193 RepID=A0ABT4CYM0_9CLOT|nr:HNH endonuclease [Clostridium aestuarii]